MDVLIGRCGIACGLCKLYDDECLGCEEENGRKHSCVIYNCSEKKSTKYCIQCPEAPCKSLTRHIESLLSCMFPSSDPGIKR